MLTATPRPIQDDHGAAPASGAPRLAITAVMQASRREACRPNQILASRACGWEREDRVIAPSNVRGPPIVGDLAHRAACRAMAPPRACPSLGRGDREPRPWPSLRQGRLLEPPLLSVNPHASTIKRVFSMERRPQIVMERH